MTLHRIGWSSKPRKPHTPTGFLATAAGIAVVVGSLVSTACGGTTAPAVDADRAAAVDMTATTTVTGSQIRVDVTATNRGTKPIRYEGNTCGAVSFALYHTENETDPAWRSPGVICTLWASIATLAPGDSVVMFASYAPDMGLDGPTPPAGTYAVKATVGFAGTTRTVDAGTATVGE